MVDNQPNKIESVENEPKKECPTCQVDTLLISFATAHTACEFIKDEDKKNECMAWAEELDPEEIEDSKKIINGVIDRVGIEGLDKVARSFNLVVKNTVIERVTEKLQRRERGEDVEIPKEEMELFKQYTMKHGI